MFSIFDREGQTGTGRRQTDGRHFTRHATLGCIASYYYHPLIGGKSPAVPMLRGNRSFRSLNGHHSPAGDFRDWEGCSPALIELRPIKTQRTLIVSSSGAGVPGNNCSGWIPSVRDPHLDISWSTCEYRETQFPFFDCSSRSSITNNIWLSDEFAFPEGFHLHAISD